MISVASKALNNFSEAHFKIHSLAECHFFVKKRQEFEMEHMLEAKTHLKQGKNQVLYIE